MIKKTIFGVIAAVALLNTVQAAMLDTIVEGLRAADIKFTQDGDKVITEWTEDRVVVLSADEEKKQFKVEGFSRTGVPTAKRAAALEKVNDLNRRTSVKFYLDEDGDIRVERYVDTDDMPLSRAVVCLTVGSLAKGLEEGREEMMKIRYGS
ncbi:MAG: YbjN domain-containing protein [Clostridia bacterium]|nr:YbjN domain-containing protein [Clostridia bacterium]